MSDLVMEDAVLDLSDIVTETAIVHTMPLVGTRRDTLPSFRFAPTSSLSMADIEPGICTVITGTAPISGQELEACREELADALASLRREAEAEGNDGFLLGFDPLNPTVRIPSSELALGADCLFVWNRAPGEGPVFEWDQVAHLCTTPLSIGIYLIDGRTVFLYANIDWWNRLS